MGLVHEGMAQHGTAVFTTRQTMGKGQRGKQWISEPGKNLALTIVVQPKGLSTSEVFKLSMATAVALRNSLEKFIGEGTTIKWPNDIYWRDRKAAGILIENVIQSKKWRFAVVGIGCNINQVRFPGLQRKAVSIKQITGKEYDPKEIAQQICNEFKKQWERMKSDASGIAADYQHHLYKLNERMKLRHENRLFEAVIKGVNSHGQLVVQHALEEKFNVGEVEWVR